MNKVTPCGTCGKAIEYTTRKPRLCASCKDKPVAERPKKKKRRSFPKKKNTQGELLLFRVLDEIMGEHVFINHGYYSFLRSPKNQPLQLDRYYPDLKLAFEFDGKQHDEFNKYIHKTKERFDYLQECDKRKDAMCKQTGVLLIRIKHNMKLTPDSVRDLIQKESPALHKRLFQ